MENAHNIPIFQFPPGVRFYPSDEELIVYYLLNKVHSRPLPAAVIGEIELYNHNPWDLPKKAPFGEDEWYFFSPRERKYPNGARPNRTAASGYWKATGTDKPITKSSGARIGVKKALVFYIGKPPNGVKTEWLMIEYRIPDTLIRPQRSKGSMRLDDWVLCRIKQKGNMSKNIHETPLSPNKPEGEIQNMNIFPQMSTNPQSEVCSNYFLSQDCHLLAKLLASQDLPQVGSVSTSTSQSSNVGMPCNTNSEHGSSIESQGDSSYFLGSYNHQGNYSQSTKTMSIPSNTSFYNSHESSGVFNVNLSNAMTNLHGGLDVSQFGETFQQ